MAVTSLEGCNNSLHPGNLGLYPHGPFLTQCLGSTQFLQRPPTRVASSVAASSMGGWLKLAEHFQEWLSQTGPPEILLVGLHPLRQHHQRRRHTAPLLPSTQGCSPPKGVVGPVWAGWISLPNTGEPAHGPWSSPTVPLRHPGRGTLDLAVGGNPSDGDIWVPGEPGSSLILLGAQKMPISFRPAPGSCLLPGFLPAPATS